MKKKTTRKPWSIERALALDKQRTTTPLTWGELGKQEGMSAGAIRQTMLKYLKQAKTVIMEAADLKEQEIAQIRGEVPTPTINDQDLKAFIESKISRTQQELNAWEIIRSIHG